MIDVYNPPDLRAVRTPTRSLTHGQWCKGFGWVSDKADAALGCTCGAERIERERYSMARDAEKFRRSDPRTAALAIKIADEYVCDFIRNEGGSPDGDTWLDVGVLDAMVDALKYAALRGLIERHPTKRTQFRFTEAGKELL